MKRILPVLLLFVVSGMAHAQQKSHTTGKKPATQSADAAGRHIAIKLTPLKNCKVYLGSYYGTGMALMDSTQLNANSEGVFKGPNKLTGGIYFVVSPEKTMQFDLLMDKNQHFSIAGDTAAKDKVVITGSPENDLYKQYAHYMGELGPKLTAAKQAYQSARTKADSSKALEESKQLTKEMEAYRDGISEKHPNSLLAVLLNTMKVPNTPAIPIVNGKADSSYPYRYVKEHYWDDVLFNDDRLLHTPFFERKLDEYFKNLVSPDPDSIINEVKYILLSARTGKEIYPYLLTKFTNKYMNPEYMGQDKVFIYIFENFYAKGDTVLLNPASRKTVTERAYSLMANQLGQPAPEITLTDTTGQQVSLHALSAPFTFIVFWDPNCGHCKEEVPRVDSIYRAKWKKEGVQVYSVNIYENAIPEWKKFIHDKHLSPDWIQVYETKEQREEGQKQGKINYRQLYDIYKTPTMYLLDKDHHIIAKQLSVQQFDDIINAKLKSGK